MSEALYTVEIGWHGKKAAGGPFLVGNAGSRVAPAIDTPGYARIGYPFTPIYSGDYANVSGEGRYQTVDFTISKEFDSNHIGVGKLDLTLNDVWPGRYNPKNTASPLYGLIRPMRPARVLVTLNGVTSDLFHGWLVESEDDPDYGSNEARFQFQDFTIWLEREKNITIASTGPTTIGEVIGLIHDEIGLIDPALRDFAEGEALNDFSADNEAALDLISGLLAVDLGYYFISREGVATYCDRYEMSRRQALGVFQVAKTAIPGTSLAYVKNRATSTKTGGVEQTYFDEDSRSEFGFGDHSDVTSDYFRNDAHAAGHAEWRVIQTKEPVSSLWAFEVSEGPTGYFQSMTSADLLDRVTVDTVGMALQDHHVLKIVHRGEAGKLHKTNWQLIERSLNQPFIVGVSKVAPAVDSAGYDRVAF